VPASHGLRRATDLDNFFSPRLTLDVNTSGVELPNNLATRMKTLFLTQSTRLELDMLTHYPNKTIDQFHSKCQNVSDFIEGQYSTRPAIDILEFWNRVLKSLVCEFDCIISMNGLMLNSTEGEELGSVCFSMNLLIHSLYNKTTQKRWISFCIDSTTHFSPTVAGIDQSPVQPPRTQNQTPIQNLPEKIWSNLVNQGTNPLESQSVDMSSYFRANALSIGQKLPSSNYPHKHADVADDMIGKSAPPISNLVENKSMQSNSKGSSTLSEAAVALVMSRMKQPLLAIEGNLDNIDYAITNFEEYRLLQPLLSSSKAAIRMLSTLTNDLLDSSLIAQGHFKLSIERFNLKNIVEECIETLRLAAEAMQNRVELRFIGTDSNMISDKQRISQVILNFLSNSIKHTQKGKISLTCHEHKDTYQVIIENISLNAYDVQVNSLNIPDLAKDDVNQMPGLGLGLFICKKLLKRIGPDKQKLDDVNRSSLRNTVSFHFYKNLNKASRRHRVPFEMISDKQIDSNASQYYPESKSIFELNQHATIHSRDQIERQRRSRKSFYSERVQVSQNQIKSSPIATKKSFMSPKSFLGRGDASQDMRQEPVPPISMIADREVTILILASAVTDTEKLATYTQKVSENLSFSCHVKVKNTVSEALDFMRTETCHIVVTELELSDGSATSAMEEAFIKPGQPKLPLFVLCTEFEQQPKVKSLFYRCLIKPVALDKWQSMLEDALGELRSRLLISA
jgi:two-component sensor histidine kinase